jgi:hypothetical protein
LQGGDAFLGDAQGFGKAGLPGGFGAGVACGHGGYLRGLFRSC